VAATSESKNQSQKSQKPAQSLKTAPPSPPDALMPSYASSPYSTATTADPYPSDMSTAVPETPPSMAHFSDAFHAEDAYQTEDTMSSYMTYPIPPQYKDYNPQVYPLFLRITFSFSPLTELASDPASFTLVSSLGQLLRV
jgi:hypothetical protein